MYLQRLLQINMAALAALATLLLGMGQDSPARPLLVSVLAAASIWLTDIKGWVRLSRMTASLLALPVVAFCALRMLRLEGEARMMVLADLVICLQMILFYQKKETAIYWQLAVISLLQVVAATAFSHGVMFGVLLVLFMMTGMSALTLLCLHVQGSRYQRAGARCRYFRAGNCRHFRSRDCPNFRSGDCPAFASPDAIKPEAQARDATLGASLALQASMGQRPATNPDPVFPDAPGSRWPVAAAAAFANSSVGSSRAGLVRELFLRLATLAAGTLVLTLVIFFTVPRLGHSAWRGATVNMKTVVGFSDSVLLGQLGEILESREEVMRVQLIEPHTRALYARQPMLYLRGTVLDFYGRGQWTNRGNRVPVVAASNRSADPPGAAETAATAEVVLQKIIVEPLDREELFCIWPPLIDPQDRSVEFDPARRRLLRGRQWRGRQFLYQLGTTAFAGGHLTPLVPCNDPGRGAVANDRPVDIASLLQVPQLPHLLATARKWVAESGFRPHQHLAIARLLESRLGQSGRFRYTLQGQPRDPGLDPIEDFMVNNPRGHCEYFATALVLMLRSQGIPARLVLGYKCDEWNNLGKFYQVRQSDAHAWVEAYLAPGDIPPELVSPRDDRRMAGGAWLRLDATPLDEAAAASRSALGRIDQALNWIDSLWANYVVEMDRQRQNDAIYQPAVNAVKKATRNLGNRQWWRDFFHGLGQWLNFSRWNGPGGWLLHVGLPLLVGIPILGLACRRMWRATRRLYGRLAGRAALHARRPRPRVEFYRRFESLLARQGLRRAAGQTPQEFARVAAARLAGAGDHPELAALPGHVVAAFYRVRFGGLPLDNSQRETVEHGLAELAQWQSQGRRKP